METLDLEIDVTEAVALGEPARIAATVFLPPAASLGEPPVVCFAKPGGGFSRHYFTADLPGPASGSQAEWHADRGQIFVALDSLGVGDSSQHEPASRLDFNVVTAGNRAAERTILERLEAGILTPDFPAIRAPVSIGIGHSMGGCLTLVQQGRHHSYDGIAILGFSARHIRTPTPADRAPVVAAWRLPTGGDESPVLLNEKAFVEAFRACHDADPTSDDVLANRSSELNTWLYFYDDVLEHLAAYGPEDSPWMSPSTPGLIKFVLTPGIVAPEAAAVDVPVLAAVGERDVVADLWREPGAYLSTQSMDLYQCPRMGHMHNFAGTRELLWQRLHNWIQWVVCNKHTDVSSR